MNNFTTVLPSRWVIQIGFVAVIFSSVFVQSDYVLVKCIFSAPASLLGVPISARKLQNDGFISAGDNLITLF